LSPRTIRAYTDDGALLIRQGMPAAGGIRREHIEAFIAAELERTAPREDERLGERPNPPMFVGAGLQLSQDLTVGA
jgi:hypothetical protein